MRSIVLLTVAGALLGAGLLVSCSSSGSSGSTSSGMATATVMISDPTTCQAPNGPFAHVYVTVTDVKASVNADAGDNDPSFVDLTPGLSSAPKQIDLLGQANNQCFLASLGSTQQLQAGSYQQIRIFLADNSASVANNACNSAANCVVLNNGTSATLQLSSESKTGIKIPSGQIASGQFNIAAGQTKDLDIDFNTCVSIVQEGNGEFRLKPVLHAGEVTTTATSINGTVLDSATGKPVNGGVTVALEQPDSNGIDRIFMTESTDSSGGFVFCPLPSGSYDVVIVAETNSGLAYAPVVVSGVSPGDTVSTVQLQTSTAVSAATLNGTVSSQGTSAATSVDVQLSFLEQVANNLNVTIPLLPNATQSSAMLALTTAGSGSCPAGSDCATYNAVMPATAAYVGAYAAGGIALAQAGTSTLAYTADAIAFVPSSGGTLDCSPSEVKSPTPVVPVPGAIVPMGTLAFSGCQ